ncbi:unnamed protein product [Macrosiphum euphorbiae]|uniref:Uncharacterized protein n=1 Tax=Macrosiphum euphorbiae TaxID=13131 RepID=A0AAV0Y7L9_9HEMI|nr:unnamed protein product [Macrosiphum euphorbiae]
MALRMANGWWEGAEERPKTMEERLNSCCRGATIKEFGFYIVSETTSIGRGSDRAANRTIREPVASTTD